MEEFHKMFEEKLKQIAAFKEKYIEAWIAETGLLPSQCMIMQENMHGVVSRMWIEKKPDEPLLKPESEYFEKWHRAISEAEDFVIQTRKRLLELERD